MIILLIILCLIIGVSLFFGIRFLSKYSFDNPKQRAATFNNSLLLLYFLPVFFTCIFTLYTGIFHFYRTLNSIFHTYQSFYTGHRWKWEEFFNNASLNAVLTGIVLIGLLAFFGRTGLWSRNEQLKWVSILIYISLLIPAWYFIKECFDLLNYFKPEEDKKFNFFNNNPYIIPVYAAGWAILFLLVLFKKNVFVKYITVCYKTAGWYVVSCYLLPALFLGGFLGAQFILSGFPVALFVQKSINVIPYLLFFLIHAYLILKSLKHPVVVVKIAAISLSTLTMIISAIYVMKNTVGFIEFVELFFVNLFVLFLLSIIMALTEKVKPIRGF